MTHLFEPLTIRGVTLRNRVGISPMCMYSSVDGHATDWHLVHLGARAVGGAALIFAEATAVEDIGRISPEDAGLWTDSQIEPLARITKFIDEYGGTPAIQLAHAGRKASTYRPWEKEKGSVPKSKGGWQSVGPSAIPFDSDYDTPTELSISDIDRIKQSFLDATKRSIKAGYKWLELHAAHGYLCHSFHSPLSNQRKDKYGGSFENRIRLTLETVEAMRAIWPQEYPMSVRLSCTDWYEGGWTLDESIELAKKLKELKIDVIDCSSGAGTPLAKIPVGASYQVPFAEAIKKKADIMTAAVGMITEPMQADSIIRMGQADIILLARESLRDPYWAVNASRVVHQNDKIKLPAPYQYAAYPKG